MASTVSDVQKMDVEKIVVTLSALEVVIEPGGVAQLVVTMTNQQDAADRLSLEVEGVDVEWYAIPVAAVNVAPGAQASERILFKLARSSENRAGSYPFLVRVQAMETGEVGVAQATLVVKPFSSLQVELNPKRAAATFFHPLNDFDTTIANLGNAEETLELYASDPEDGCAYEFDTDRITLKPGHSQIVPLAIRPKVSSVLGSPRLYGFTVSARSVTDSYVSTNAHGQIEKHALISPLLGIFCLLLGLAGGGWWVFHPRPVPPPTIHVFSVSADNVKYGQEVTLTWDVSKNYRQLVLFHRVNGKPPDQADGELPTAVGSITVKPQYPETTYELIARYGNQKEVKKEIEIQVGPPPIMPKPSIKFFSADPLIIHQGETSTLMWEARGDRELLLSPGNPSLNRYQQSISVAPTQDTVYTLLAVGLTDDLRPAQKTVTVQVKGRDEAIAKIAWFAAQPSTVYIGDKVRLKWGTRYARSVHLDSDRGDVIGTDLSASGNIEVPNPIQDKTTFTITALDSLGNKTTKSVTVTPVARPVVPPPSETTPPDAPSPDGTPTPSTPPGTGTAKP
jgi:hypothetical protein